MRVERGPEPTKGNLGFPLHIANQRRLDFEVDVDRAERLRTEFVQGLKSLPVLFRAL